MNLIKLGAQRDGYVWRCNECKKEGHGKLIQTTIRKFSWFEKSNLSIKEILLLMYHWGNKPMEKISETVHEIHVGAKTVIDWRNMLRDMCQKW